MLFIEDECISKEELEERYLDFEKSLREGLMNSAAVTDLKMGDLISHF